MAAQEEEDSMAMDPHQLQIPTRRVKNIMKLDKDINKVNSEALHLIAYSTELFIEFLAEKSARVALEKRKKTIRLEHLRVAVKRHQPTGDFLLGSLPKPSMPSDQQLPKDRNNLIWEGIDIHECSSGCERNDHLGKFSHFFLYSRLG